MRARSPGWPRSLAWKTALEFWRWEELRALRMWRGTASPEPPCENISYSISRMKCAVLRNCWVWSQSWVCMHFLYFTEKLPRLCFESFDDVYIYTHALIGFGNERAKHCPSWPDVCCQISGRGSNNPGCSAGAQGTIAALCAPHPDPIG